MTDVELAALKAEVARLREQNTAVARQSADFACRIYKAADLAEKVVAALRAERDPLAGLP
jgi:predicted transcriptional regulator